MVKESEANDPAITTKIDPLVPMSGRELVTVIATGIVVGAIACGLFYLLNRFVFGAVLCRPQSAAECVSAPGYAMTAAIIISSIAGLAALARLRVYRPLLVVLAAAISLWGIQHLVAGLSWYMTLIVVALLFGFTYGLYAWLARIRSFIFAVVVCVVLVVVARLSLNS